MVPNSGMMWHQVTTMARPWLRLRLDGSRRRLPAPAPRPALSRRRWPGPGSGSGWTDPAGRCRSGDGFRLRLAFCRSGPASVSFSGKLFLLPFQQTTAGRLRRRLRDPFRRPGPGAAFRAGSFLAAFQLRELPGRLPGSIRPGGSGSASGFFFR